MSSYQQHIEAGEILPSSTAGTGVFITSNIAREVINKSVTAKEVLIS
jgi:hypothetical protein